MKNKKNLYSSCIFILLVVLSSFFVSSNYNIRNHDINDVKLSDASDINLDETSLTVPYGTNVQEDKGYIFSGQFYDITDDLRVWSETAYLETQFVLDPDVYSNDSITDLDNTEIQSPANDSISMTSGTQYQNGTLYDLDDDYAIFNSTDDNLVEATNFTVNYGDEVSTGNLTEIDGDYSEYQSIYETGSVYVDNFTLNNGSFLQNGTIFPATYSFEDDTVGENPTSWTVDETGGTVNIISSFINHEKVVELLDDDSGNSVSLYDTVSQQVNGTLEYWVCINDVDERTYINIYDSVDYIVLFYIDAGYFYHYDGSTYQILSGAPIPQDNMWYHIRIDFECGSGGYLGLSEDTYQIWIDNVNYGAFDTRHPRDYINKVTFGSGVVQATYNVYFDAIGYSWDSNYTIGDNRYSNDTDLNYIDDDYMVYQSNQTDHSLNITSTFQSNIESQGLTMCYSLKTNISQTINISVYNFDTEQYDLMNSSVSLDFTEDHFILNSSYCNATNHIMLNVIGINATCDFYLYFEMLYITNTPIIEIESIIGCSLLDNLVYSYSTNITQSVELYLYNFTTSSYDLIENQSYTSFYLNHTSILSDYHNGTSIKIKFRAVNSTFNDFSLYLEVLKVSNITRLNFTLYVELEEFYDYFIHFNCSAWYYTPILTLVNFSIYDFENSEWILINSSSNDVNYSKSEYIENTVYMYDLIDTDNDNQVLLRFQALNDTNEFDLYLDCLNLTIHRKLLLSCEKTFTLLGTWKYRFHIPEDDYSSSWYYFDVVEHADNFMAVSESPYITKWVLINNETEISTSRRFIDDGDYQWNLYDEDDELADTTFTKTINTNGDATVHIDRPNSNFGSWEMVYIRYIYGDDIYRSFIKFPEFTDYFYLKGTSIFDYWYGSAPDYIDFYTSNSFTESTITWNNQPATIEKLLSNFWFGHIYTNVGEINENLAFAMFPSSLDSYVLAYGDSKEGQYWDCAKLRLTLYKFNQESDFFIIQGSETEILKAKSEQFNDIFLLANDYLSIDCEANVENLQLQLLHDGSVVDTMDVLKNNMDEDRQLIEVSVDDDVVFDQLQFTGVFDDTEYFKCYSVRADGYDTTTREQTTTTYIAPEESETLLLSTGEHLLKIYDSDILRTYKWINITHDMQDNLEIYRPIYITNCRLALIDQDNSLLDFNLFEIYATRTLLDITSRIPLLDEFFDADQGTTIKFEFHDRFGDFIKNETREVETYIYIEIDSYSLKIKNDAVNYSNIVISKTGSSTEIEDILAPDELHEYKLITGNYTIEYTNNENNEIITYDITLSEDWVLTLPTSYFDIYFSIFNFDGLGLNHELFRFYINNERRDFGINTMTQIVNNLKVMDFFNATVFDSNINLGGKTECNILVEVYTIFIINNYNRTIKIEIERENSPITLEQIIPSRSGLEYRFLPDIEYTVSAYEQDGVLLDSETFTLESQYQIVDFGFYHTTVPLDPTPIIANIYVMFWVAIIVFVIAGILLYLHYRLKRKTDEIPPHVKNRYGKKKKGVRGFYNDRIDLERV